ncbi:UNVERIFIED_CONTAM: hypothetical protein H355_007662, partial [Colinus virginianus]
ERHLGDNDQFGWNLSPFILVLPDTVKTFQKMAETENLAILLQSTSIRMNYSPIEDFILNTEPSVTQTVLDVAIRTSLFAGKIPTAISRPLYSAPSRWRAYMGLRAVNEKSNHVAMRSIKRIIIHPQYDQSISDYDIALLEMEAQVFFSELVQPICLPSSSRVFLYGTVCYVTGWGAMKENSHLARTLQEARVRIINQSICSKLYDDLITSRMLCAGNLNGGIDACQGDSGGPLACAGKGNRWYLAGIVSWGEGCARRNRPGVYTKVTALYDWIRQNTN